MSKLSLNRIQYALFVASHEDGEIREVISDITREYGVDREIALELLKSEVDYLLSEEDICLFRSETQDFPPCQMLDKRTLEQMTLEEIELHEDGPYYYVSGCKWYYSQK